MKFAFLLFCFYAVYGEIEDHFKRVLNKSNCYSMRNIDYIYLINLDQRPEKLRMSLSQLAPYGVFPHRFSAVNGWELSLEAINDVGVKFSPFMEGGFMATCYHLDQNRRPSHEVIENLGQTYFVHTLTCGGVGCALSHLSIIQDAYNSNYQTIWVMEDDIEVVRDPSLLSDLIEELDGLVGPNGWDVLFTDRDFRGPNGEYIPAHGAARRPDISRVPYKDFSFRAKVSPKFHRISARYGTASMIIRRSGMRKLLQYYKTHQIYLPYDMDLIYANGIQLFCLEEDVVTNLAKAISDLGGPFYLEKTE
jgi:GR25 family glycosyltransferase involved in LPS biosynthesis